MSRLTDLVRAAKQLDPQLGEDLEAEIRPLQERLPFGLNFERHAPEAVELAGHRIRKGSKVRVLPPRGSTERGDQRIWRVEAVHGESADISTHGGTDIETASASLDDLILVAEFRDRIYPGLRFDGSVECGRDRPFHSIINGENFHVLEQLTFTHEHSVDAIYIDPPYNTGARDWKYNNDYVEGDDLYRHSKWLAFMERRLRLAKRLLKPDDSVLIITIDEKECARLGLLLEQVFPGASIQMVTSVINPSGSSRSSGFSRADEYIYFVMFGVSDAASWTSDMLRQDATKRPVRWDGLMRTGGGSDRADRPGLFYPIFFHEDSGTFHTVGDPIPAGSDRRDVAVPLGTFPVWPLTGNRERRWRVGPTKARELASKGYLRFGPWQPGSRSRTIYYLPSGSAGRVDSGELSILSRDRDGSVVLSDEVRSLRPMSVWNMKSHSAAEWGTGTVRSLLPGRQFPYPKSLYAVEDALRFFVANKPHSVVLDFFAGSGTTAHAIMRLNRQDKGSRQCISVTNNEVSADEQTKLREQGFRPGDSEWERRGICDYITKPRLRASITGSTPEGQPVKGDYKFVDEFPMSEGFEENAAFFTLTYESPWRVSTDRAFAAIAPMLWLRAGAVGRRIDAISNGWEVADSYGIINDLDQSSEFIAALQAVEGIRIAYIVTDDEGRYQQVANEIPGIETVRLYEDYLRNCEMTGDF